VPPVLAVPPVVLAVPPVVLAVPPVVLAVPPVVPVVPVLVVPPVSSAQLAARSPQGSANARKCRFILLVLSRFVRGDCSAPFSYPARFRAAGHR